MTGIQFITDEKGHKTAAVIDLKKHKALWEDIQDVLVSQSRIREKGSPLDKVKADFIKRGKLRAIPLLQKIKYAKFDGTVEVHMRLGAIPSKPTKWVRGKPVFVLTAKRTFSGAEEFTYNLKNLKRATIIGETTGGGAHPVSGHRVDDHFMIGVPF